ncbi:zinc ribbon domain-containing protein [Lactobacillus helveticus]|uniref:zinc ribbon domain-containing protein n=1 Tax=Lactobacillus helveticus TaxID=1587 RepID=UPI003D2FB1A0
MGRKNNQNFIGIPHKVMIDMIQYKANLAGISVIRTNESYTSQTSALCWIMKSLAGKTAARVVKDKAKPRLTDAFTVGCSSRITADWLMRILTEPCR